MTDYNLYQFNRYGRAFWEEAGADGATLPLELNYHELRELGADGGELLIYGYLPMMVSAGCVKKTLGACRHEPGQTTITDRYRKTFPVRNECDYCYNVIYNHVPLYLADRGQEIEALQPGSRRLMFTVESKKETARILALVREGQAVPEGAFTRGHWKRGIK